MAGDQVAVLYTIGYEGRTPTNLVRTLTDHGVKRLVDVRLQPSSRIKGFSLIALFERLRKVGITYEHIRELGNPQQIRSLFYEGEMEEGRRQFRAHLENGSRAAVDVLVGLSRIEPTAILCRERDVEECHRAVIADMVVENSRGEIRVENL